MLDRLGEPMVNACLYSGGKDSTLALHKAVAMGIRIDLLITMQPKRTDSYMFHHPNTKWTSLQSQALGIRHIFAETHGEKEAELEDLERTLVENDVTLLVTGATYSKYQADRIARILEEHKMQNVAPLWHIEPMEELNELSATFDAIITSVSAEGFGEDMLGQRIDERMINRLIDLNKKYGANMLFEGGEAESFVLDAPLFKKRITILDAETEFSKGRGTYIIKDAILENKK